MTLRATIANADRRFWPGRFVKVRLVLDTLPGAVLVPAGAPQMSAKGPFVYVVKDDAPRSSGPSRPASARATSSSSTAGPCRPASAWSSTGQTRRRRRGGEGARIDGAAGGAPPDAPRTAGEGGRSAP